MRQPPEAPFRRLSVIVPSTVAAGEGLPAEVRALNVPATFVGHLQVVCLTADGRAEGLGQWPMRSPGLCLEDLRVAGAGVARLLVTDVVSGIGGMSNPFEVTDDPDVPRIVWVRLVRETRPGDAAQPWLVDASPGGADLDWIERIAGRRPGPGWLLGVVAAAGEPQAGQVSGRTGASYVTTGPRILLRVCLADGLRVRVSGTALLRSVTVFKNRRPVHRIEPGALDAEIAVSGEVLARSGPQEATWVAVEQADGAGAWSRPTAAPPP